MAESDAWNVAVAIMENVREAQKRAERDSLRFIGLAVAFVFLKVSAASELTFAGLKLQDLELVRIALLPVAAYEMAYWVKAETLTRVYAAALTDHLDDRFAAGDPPPHVRPPDWDLLQDIHHVLPRLGKSVFVAATAGLMFALLLAAVVSNLVDAADSHLFWAILSTAVTVIFVAAAIYLAFPAHVSLVG
jgi:hypothetical protein